MRAYLFQSIIAFFLSAGSYIIAQHFRLIGQHILDTGIAPEAWIVHVHTEERRAPRISGYLLKWYVSLCGYAFAVGTLYLAIESLFRAVVEVVGEDAFVKLSVTNADLLIAVLLLAFALEAFLIARRLRSTGKAKRSAVVREGNISDWAGLTGYLLAVSLFVFAILVPLNGRIWLLVFSTP